MWDLHYVLRNSHSGQTMLVTRWRQTSHTEFPPTLVNFSFRNRYTQILWNATCYQVQTNFTHRVFRSYISQNGHQIRCEKAAWILHEKCYIWKVSYRFCEMLLVSRCKPTSHTESSRAIFWHVMTNHEMTQSASERSWERQLSITWCYGQLTTCYWECVSLEVYDISRAVVANDTWQSTVEPLRSRMTRQSRLYWFLWTQCDSRFWPWCILVTCFQCIVATLSTTGCQQQLYILVHFSRLFKSLLIHCLLVSVNDETTFN